MSYFELLASSATVSALVCTAITVLNSRKRPVAADWPRTGQPQKIHQHPVPRIGGIAIFLAVIVISWMGSEPLLLTLAAVGLIGLCAGLAEDFTHRISPATRYAMALLAAGVAYTWADVRIVRLDVQALDQALALWPVSLALTVFAIASFAHAVNLSDGLNGLAAGLMILSLTAISQVARMAGDAEIAMSCWVVMGALIGFLAFNFPLGKIFLGDGGAYFTGMILAILAVLLVQRNPEVSAWFALTVLAHPVLETLHTVARRSLLHQSPIGQPDRWHLHTLLYQRLLQLWPDSHRKSNALASTFLLLINVGMCALATVHWQQKYWLVAQFTLFAILFVLSWHVLMRMAATNVRNIS